MSDQTIITCCLCGEPVPPGQDAYALDAEWRRRFPSMTGTLACSDCALSRNYWECRTGRGRYVAGHIPARRAECVDSWSHISSHGTHAGMVAWVAEHGCSGVSHVAD